jgi:type I restriction enzyme M protein
MREVLEKFDFDNTISKLDEAGLLFLQHMLGRMKPAEEGSRVAIVMNGSPLFTGDAGSGESEIRRWILESDWLEAIVALPEQLFYNTGIATYVWILTNRKAPARRGKVQLIDATAFWSPMRKSTGDKRREIAAQRIRQISDIFTSFQDGEHSKIFKSKDGYPEPNPDLRDTENVPLGQDVNAYFEREVKPHVPDAWINTALRDHKDGQVGYEINFNRYFYTYTPPRPLAEIEADMGTIEQEIMAMLREVAG